MDTNELVDEAARLIGEAYDELYGLIAELSPEGHHMLGELEEWLDQFAEWTEERESQRKAPGNAF